MPRVDLSSLFDAAAAYVVDRGGSIRKGTTVTGVAHAATTSCRAAAIPTSRSPTQSSPWAAPARHLLGGAIESPEAAHAVACVEQFAYEPIVTAYLKYDRPLGLAQPMQKLAGTPGQWLFDRGQLEGPDGLAAVVISTEQPGARQDHAALLRAIDDQLRRLLPGLPPPAWLKVIAERRATYACRAGLTRPPPSIIAPHLYLAGDYTDPEFPATLEAAARARRGRARAAGHTLSCVASAEPSPRPGRGALHQYGVDPAIEFATDRCQAADARSRVRRAARSTRHCPTADHATICR
jgi:hypothetical protein